MSFEMLKLPWAICSVDGAAMVGVARRVGREVEGEEVGRREGEGELG